MEFGIDFYSKMVPEPPQAAPREPKKVVSVTPVWLPQAPPCESLPAPWHCLGASKTFWEPEDPNCLVLMRFGTQISTQNRGFVSHVSNISSFFALALFFHALLLSWISLLLSSCLLSYVILHVLASEHLSFQASEWPRRVIRNTNIFSESKMYQNSCCIVYVFLGAPCICFAPFVWRLHP